VVKKSTSNSGKTTKKVAKKVISKNARAKKAPAKKSVAKKAPAKKSVAKKAPAKKAPAKAAAKKVSTRSPNIVKPTLAKRAPGRPFPAKLQSTTKGDSTTITVTPHEIAIKEVVVEERRLVMTPPPRPTKVTKKGAGLKLIKGAPTPLVVEEGTESWTTTELKAMRSELAKELIRLRAELAEVESGMEDLISAAGVGAGDDQADAGTKTFEREHEMSLVYNAKDMVLQTERALERIDSKTYGRCEECENSIGKARLQVFPRATMCMACEQKEERR
jgi:RNA polymerase-binding transcription factor DksA